MSAVAYDTSGPFAVITSQGSPGTWSIFIECQTRLFGFGLSN
jgi:hypothetical protein